MLTQCNQEIAQKLLDPLLGRHTCGSGHETRHRKICYCAQRSLVIDTCKGEPIVHIHKYEGWKGTTKLKWWLVMMSDETTVLLDKAPLRTQRELMNKTVVRK